MTPHPTAVASKCPTEAAQATADPQVAAEAHTAAAHTAARQAAAHTAAAHTAADPQVAHQVVVVDTHFLIHCREERKRATCVDDGR